MTSRPPVVTPTERGDVAASAARLRDRLDGLDAATARLLRVESSLDAGVAGVTSSLRTVAAAGGATVPVMVAPAARDTYSQHPAVVEAEHIVRARALQLAARRRRVERRAARVEPALVGLVGGAVSFVVGLVTAVGTGRLPVDAVARVASAQAMVAGRDPHPESIGFIWGPFPTLFAAPLAALRGVWPELTSRGVAGIAVSSVCLGLLLAQLVAWGRSAGAPAWFRVAVVALAAAHPLVLLYGANGMSETCWLLFMVVAVRHLARWWESDDVVALAVAGLALGLAYLTRYETVASIGAVAVLVVVVAWRRPLAGADASSRDRFRAAAVDGAVVLFPAVAAVVGWAGASWAVIGEPFAQFTSQYGNRALVVAGRAGSAALVGDASAAGRAWFFLRQALVAAPALVPVVLLGAWIGGRTARRTSLAVTVLGAPLALQGLLALQGQTFPWFRYVVPGVVLTTMVALAVGGRSGWTAPRRWVRPLLVAALVPGVVVAWGAVRAGALGAVEEQQVVDGVVRVVERRPVPVSSSLLLTGARVAADIDALARVAPGAVLTDTASTSMVVAAAPRPEVYVVPSDRDFLPVVADPAVFGVRYLLLRSPATAGDALSREYPELWDRSTDPLARPVRTWGSPRDRAGAFRLFEIRSPRGAPRATPTQEPGR